MIALAAPSSAAERARVPETGEPIWGMVSEVQACTVTPEAAAPASQSEESPSIESAPPDSAGGVVRASEGIEPLALENKQASEVASVAYREWETHASSEAEMPAREIEPHDERLEHIGRSQEPAHEPLASEEILLGSMSGEAVSGEEPSRAPLRSEEAASEQQLLSEEEPREIASSSEASGEEPSVATKLPMHAVTEPAERPPELGAEATDLAVGRPADDENAGTAARSHDTAAQSADDAVETVLSAADDIESLLETEPADSPPTAVQPTSPQEDLDDLFEPLPLEHEGRPAAASTATPESARQMFSRGLPPPAFSSPVTQTAASPVQRAPLAAAPAGTIAPTKRSRSCAPQRTRYTVPSHFVNKEKSPVVIRVTRHGSCFSGVDADQQQRRSRKALHSPGLPDHVALVRTTRTLEATMHRLTGPTVAAVALCMTMFVANGVSARDPDGRYANHPLKQWFDQLASGKGLCCSFADGFSVQDVDWDTQDGRYRVRLQGEWVVVPDTALVSEPNRFGPAVVWPYFDANGATQIRCFMPGAGA